MLDLVLQDQNKQKDIQLEQNNLQEEQPHDYVSTEIYKTAEHKLLTDNIDKKPPKEMPKAEKQQWKKTNKANKTKLARLQESTQEARNAFFQPSEEYAAEMTQSLDALEDKDVDSITSAFYQTMLQSSGYEQGQTLDPKTLLNDNHKDTTNFSTLCNMLSYLQETSPETLSAEKLKKMVATYKGLKLTTGEAGSVCYLSKMTESVNGNDEWSDEVAAKDPKSGYLLLYYSVTVALRGYVNQQDPTAVNQDAFSKLCAMAMASSIAAGDLCVSEDFIQKREANEEAVIAEHVALKIEQERRVAEEQRQAKEKERQAKEKERQAKEKKRQAKEKERQAKEKERQAKEKERQAKEKERQAKEKQRQETIADLRQRADELESNQQKRSTTKLQKNLEANEAKRMEARRLLGEKRTNIVKELYKTNGANRSWLDETGPELLKSFLGKDFFKEDAEFSDGFEKYIIRQLETLNASVSSIETFFNSKEKLTLGMPQLRDRLCLDAAKRLNDKLFSEKDIAGSLSSLPDMDVKKYKGRQNALGKLVNGLSPNQVADIWAIPSLQSMILNDKITDKEFGTKMKEVHAQARANELMITDRLKKHVSIYSMKTAMSEIKESLGGLWFLAAPAVLSVHLDDRLRNQSIYMPRTKESEKPVLKAISAVGLNAGLLPTISEYLKKEKVSLTEPKALSNSLNKFKTKKTANERYFQSRIADIELSDTTWKDFFIWFEKHECEEIDKFRSLLDGILNDLSAQYQYPKLTVNQYQKGVKEAEVLLKKSGGDYRAKLLRGEELCKHPSFEKLFVGFEDSLMEEFVKLLRSDTLKTALPFLTENMTLESLENIPYSQFQLLVKHVRGNLMQCVESWGKIEGMGSVRIKKNMLYQMMERSLSQDEFEKICGEKEKKLDEQNYANRMRLLVTLGSPALQPETIQYQHIGATQSQKTIDERIQFFMHAREVWRILESKGVHESVKVLCLKSIKKFKAPSIDADEGKKKDPKNKKKTETEKIQKKETPEIGIVFRDFMRDKIFTLEKKSLQNVNALEKEEDREVALRKLQDKNTTFKMEYNMADIVALKEMQSAFDVMNKRVTLDGELSGVRRDTMLEFMLCGCEDLLIQPGTVGEKIFKGKSKKTYDRMLYTMAENTLLRSLESDIALRCLVEGSSGKSPQEKEYLQHSLQDKLRAILAQLKPLDKSEKFNYDNSPQSTEEKKHENMKRFGVNSWDELIGQLYSWKNAGKDIFNDAETVEAVNNYHKRRTALEKFEGGIFKDVIEHLIADETVWHDMMLNTDTEFKASMIALRKKIGGALIAIKKSKVIVENNSEKNISKGKETDSSNSIVIKQFLVDNFKEIMEGKFNPLADKKSTKKKDTDKKNKSSNIKRGKISDYVNQKSPAEIEAQKKIDYWSDRLNKYGVKFLKANEGATESIEGRIKYLINKYPDKTSIIGPYLPQLITSSDELYVQLFKSTIPAYLDKLNKQAKKNLNEADKCFQEHEPVIKDRSPAEKKEAEDRKAAFEKSIEHCAVIFDNGFFLDMLPSLYDAFVKKQATQSAQKAKEELSKTGHIAVEIEARIQKGMAKDNEGDKQVEGLRHQLYHVGSPILAALNQEKDKDKDKEQFNSIIENCNKSSIAIPYLVKALMAERLSGTKKITQSKIDAELAWLNQMLSDIEKPVEGKEPLSEQRVAKALTYCYSQKLLDGSTSKSAGEYLAELEAKEKQLENLHTMKKEAVNPLYKAEISDTINCLKMGQYSMSSDAFNKLQQNKTSYLKAVGGAQAILDEEFKKWRNKDANIAKDNKNDSPEDIRLKTALMEYLRDDIRRSLYSADDSKKTSESNNTEDFRALISNRLHDGEFIKYLLERKIREENSAGNLLQLTVDRTAALPTQYDLDNAILHPNAEKKVGSTENIEKYNTLNYAQRQIFAIALSMPQDGLKQVEYMVGSKLLSDDTTMSAQHIMSLKNQIAQYINCQTFNPNVDYSRAIGRLINANKTINEKAFNEAMVFVDFCIARREESIPKDFNKLGDGDGSIAAAMHLSSNKNSVQISEETEATLNDPADNLISFKAQLFELPGIQQATKTKLDELTDYDFGILTAILQNRTMVDYTTGQGVWSRSEGKKQEFVNADQRAELVASYTKDITGDSNSITASEDYAKALTTLFSYQLRDDISLEGREGTTLLKDDFKKGALNRSTSVDWELMSRALAFLKEIKQEKHRLEIIRKTRKTFFNMKSENELNYNSVYIESSKDTTEETFHEFLEEQAYKDIERKKDEDELPLLMSGFYALNEPQKELFYTALEHREILDVSKKNYYSSALGMTERDYADPIGREELTNEYLKNSHSNGTRLKVTSDTRNGAIRSLLQAQIDDSVNLTGDKSQINNKSAEKLLFFKRDTDVDWKLFHRALQYVYRTTDEEEMTAQDNELYISQGNIKKTGSFEFQSNYLRKNLHQTGTRASRFVGRQAVDYVKGKIPGYLQQLAVGLLPVSMANSINELGIIDGNDALGYADSTLSLASDTAEKVQESMEKGVINLVGSAFSAGGISANQIEQAKNFNDTYVGLANDAFTYGTGIYSVAKDTIEISGKLNTLKKGNDEAEGYAEEDQKKTEQAALKQTEKQKDLSDSSIKRNNYSVNLSKDRAQTQITSNYVESVLSTVTDIATTATGASEWIGEAIQVGIKTARFITEVFNDVKTTNDYFDKTGNIKKEADRIRKSFDKSREDLKNKGDRNAFERDSTLLKMSDRKMVQFANGFNDSTEYSGIVGLNLVRSLLFCASKFNPQDKTRVQAISTLTALGMEGVIGKSDNASAKLVFDILMPSQYR